MVRASLIIPSYNGRALLERNLPGVLEATVSAGLSPGQCQVIVADDGSDDGTVPWLERRWGDRLRALPGEGHAGFIGTVNRAVDRARGEAVVLLNNDVEVEPGFLPPLLDALDERTFAATSRSLTDRGHNEGLSAAFFEQGDLAVVQPGVEIQAPMHDRRCTNFHASGGFSAFNRARWLELGGLDPIYHPFYWEDVDLCYRAWRRGWRCVYVPESRVRHQPHSTISLYHDEEQVKRTYQRNKHTFMLKNITAPEYFAAYARRLGRDLLCRPGSPEERRRRWGAFEMLKRMGETLASRGEQNRAAGGLTDPEILARSANVPC